MVKVGDIVEILPNAPYVITSSGTKWAVYGAGPHPRTEEPAIYVSKIPANLHEFDTLRKCMGSDRKSIDIRTRRGYRRYSVDDKFLKVVGQVANNQQYAKTLLHDTEDFEKKSLPDIDSDIFDNPAYSLRRQRQMDGSWRRNQTTGTWRR